MSYLEQIKSLKFKISKVTVDGVDFYLRDFRARLVSTLRTRRIYSSGFSR